MPESLQEQLSTIRPKLASPDAEPVSPPETVSVPEVLPPASVEAAPTVSGETVEGTAVHERGGILIDLETERRRRETKLQKNNRMPEAGDLYTDPATGDRLVVDLVRKGREGEEPTIIFSKEKIAKRKNVKGEDEVISGLPHVPAEPGRKLRQLPLTNFKVERAGYKEPKYASETKLEAQNEQATAQFNEIFDACQDVFEQVLGEYEDVSPEAETVMEQVGPLSQQIGLIEDEWNALGDDGSRATIQKKISLLDDLKNAVAQLPVPLVESHPTLRLVRREVQKRNADEEEVMGGKQKSKGKKSKNQGPEKSGEGAKKTRGQRRGARDEVALNLAAQSDRRRSGESRRGDKQEVGARLSKYQEQRVNKSTLESWWDNEKTSWEEQIAVLRDQQYDLDLLESEVERLKLQSVLDSAMQELGGDYQQAFRREERLSVAIELNALEKELGKKQGDETKNESEEFPAERFNKLRANFLHYHDILQVGERLIREALQERSKPSWEELDVTKQQKIIGEIVMVANVYIRTADALFRQSGYEDLALRQALIPEALAENIRDQIIPEMVQIFNFRLSPEALEILVQKVQSEVETIKA